MINIIRKIIKNIIKRETIFFLMVMFTNFAIAEIGISQFIYGFLALYLFLKYKKKLSGSRRFLYVILLLFLSIINYGLYNNTEALSSSMRFCFNYLICIVFLCCFDNAVYRERIINGYLYAVTFFSSLIIIQFICYYGLGFNLKLDFGDYQGTMNDASNYDPLDGLLYRTGGLFKEPSWYATFATPSVFLLTLLKRYKLLAISVMGTVCSTSGVGFAVLTIYGLWMMRKLSTIQIFVISLLVIVIMTPMFFVMEHALIEITNSDNNRLQIYFYIFENSIFSLFGINPNILYSNNIFEELFLNTLSIIYLFWGLVGLLVYIKFIYFNRIPMLTIAILAIIAIEGCYGRIDFWMMLLACSLFNRQLCADRIKNEATQNISHLLGNKRKLRALS